jgi:hypothetical protein
VSTEDDADDKVGASCAEAHLFFVGFEFSPESCD